MWSQIAKQIKNPAIAVPAALVVITAASIALLKKHKAGKPEDAITEEASPES
jgi:hypothetical protein